MASPPPPPPNKTLHETAQEIGRLLQEREPLMIEGIPADVHPLPPFVNRDEWAALGDLLRVAERPLLHNIPGEKWISLRCDGTGFGKFIRRLQQEKLWTPQYSPEFAEVMKVCCQKLMAKFSRSVCGYTQSDELTVLIPPARIVRGEQQEHEYSGRLQKVCSLACSTVSSTFVAQVLADSIQQGKHETAIQILQENPPTFDCRVGVYESEIEAVSLVLWRAYDCGVNATSDTVFKSGLPGYQKVVGLTTDERLVWLMERNLLPLPLHQRSGTLYLKRKKMFEGVNQKTGQPVTYFRTQVEAVEGCVLRTFKEGGLVGLAPQENSNDDAKNSKKKNKKRKKE